MITRIGPGHSNEVISVSVGHVIEEHIIRDDVPQYVVGECENLKAVVLARCPQMDLALVADPARDGRCMVDEPIRSGRPDG